MKKLEQTVLNELNGILGHYLDEEQLAESVDCDNSIEKKKIRLEEMLRHYKEKKIEIENKSKVIKRVT